MNNRKSDNDLNTANTTPEQPQYPKPRILLVDVDESVSEVLRKDGFNISMGSFGKPYQVEKSSDFAPMIPDYKLPNHTEQEIVIIDLLTGEPLPEAIGEKINPPDEPDWWVSCRTGIIDPRPGVMNWVRDDFDRILDHGGIFIIFAEPYLKQQIQVGQMDGLSFRPTQDISMDNWSFLEVLSNLTISIDHGTEIAYQNHSNTLAPFFEQARFSCALSVSFYLEEMWWPLAYGKFNQCVSGVILSSEQQNRNGWVFVFPHVNDKAGLLKTMLEDTLPSNAPQLFPSFEGAKWLSRAEYELPKVLKVKQEIQTIEADTQTKITELEQEIEHERAESAYLHQLISETGDVLVAAVKQALETLGFDNVIDADNQLKRGEKKREDLLIEGSPLVLVEVKGITGTPKESDALQVANYIPMRMKKLDHTNIQGMTIINHQKHLPSLERSEPFNDDIQVAAIDQNIGLLNSFDLFRLVRNFQLHGWTHEQVRDLFYQHGVIEPIPMHYEYLGKIEKYWEEAQAVEVRIEQSYIEINSRISFEFSIEFGEQLVESLQAEGESVERIETGEVAGVKTLFSKELMRKDVRVFLVKETK